MNQILESLLLKYQAQKVEAVTNLNIYLTNPCGVAEHPNIVSEGDKLIAQVSEADGKIATINSLLTEAKAKTEES